MLQYSKSRMTLEDLGRMATLWSILPVREIYPFSFNIKHIDRKKKTNNLKEKEGCEERRMQKDNF